MAAAEEKKVEMLNLHPKGVHFLNLDHGHGGQ